MLATSAFDNVDVEEVLMALMEVTWSMIFSTLTQRDPINRRQVDYQKHVNSVYHHVREHSSANPLLPEASSSISGLNVHSPLSKCWRWGVAWSEVEDLIAKDHFEKCTAGKAY
jgi:hypothetical protein